MAGRRRLGTTPRRPVNETYEETRRLREAQDVALEESKRTDRERARQRQETEERRQPLEERQRQRDRNLQQLREAREAAIPPEPTEGVMIRFRFPGGTTLTRRFSTTMSMDVMVSLAGSQPGATREFNLRLPGSSHSLPASTLTGSLSENDIRTATTIDIQWIEDDPPAFANEIPELQLQNQPNTSALDTMPLGNFREFDAAARDDMVLRFSRTVQVIDENNRPEDQQNFPIPNPSLLSVGNSRRTQADTVTSNLFITPYEDIVFPDNEGEQLDDEDNLVDVVNEGLPQLEREDGVDELVFEEAE